MEPEENIIEGQSEAEEDDYGCYFLEPSSHPYNMKEKIMKANGFLFSSQTQPTKQKPTRVKFKEELITFEPELTDEDVNSIESDHVEISQGVQSPPDNSVSLVAEEIEEATDEVVEELDSEEEFTVSVIEHRNDEAVVDQSAKSRSCRNNESKKRPAINGVHCKEHCIDRLDFKLSMSINKLEIHEKVLLPPLQLLQRKCCDELHEREQKILPSYNGYRSEYGLTLRQLERRTKQLESMRLKQQTRQKIIEEYQQRKIQQNEEVFSQWLKEVANRKAEKEKLKKPVVKQLYSPNVISLPNKCTGRAKERPKTANGFVPKAPVKKLRRPRTTSSSCVFINVPQDILERSCNIGDLIITNSKSLTKRLHILALS